MIGGTVVIVVAVVEAGVVDSVTTVVSSEDIKTADVTVKGTVGLSFVEVVKVENDTGTVDCVVEENTANFKKH